MDNDGLFADIGFSSRRTILSRLDRLPQRINHWPRQCR
jgi:hypothetical protein